MLLITSVSSACTIITVENAAAALYHQSVKLHLLTKGKPLQGASIEVYLGRPGPTNDLPYESLITGADGVALTSQLSMAVYHFVVHKPEGQEVEFVLDVPLEAKKQIVSRDTEVVATLIQQETFDSVPLTRSPAMAEPLQAWLQQFRGAVVDASGAVIPNANVKVYHVGKIGSEPLVKTQANARGEFVADLKEGKYVAIIEMPGFATQPVEFSIDPQGWKNMRVMLALGDVCGYRLAAQGKIAEY